MTEKRYYSVDYDEEYYIFDSNVISKGRVEEEAEYSYDVFANSMSSTEIIDKLNELTNENEQLKLKVNGLKSELTIWKEDANEHIQETNKLFEENKQLKKVMNELKDMLQADIDDGIRSYPLQLSEYLVSALKKIGDME